MNLKPLGAEVQAIIVSSRGITLKSIHFVYRSPSISMSGVSAARLEPPGFVAEETARVDPLPSLLRNSISANWIIVSPAPRNTVGVNL
jgi:hypothetical protein